jgi:hypothetical protein
MLLTQQEDLATYIPLHLQRGWLHNIQILMTYTYWDAQAVRMQKIIDS